MSHTGNDDTEAPMNANIITDWTEIREWLSLGFTGSVILTNRREVRGHVTPCDIVNDEHTGIFTAVTVSAKTSAAFRRINTADILAIDVRDA